MKLTASRFPIYLTLCASLASLSLRLQGEPHCPGNIASVTPRLVANALLVIPVKVNGEGPFDFMVDTGSQVSVIDPSLARQLELKSKGTVGLVTTASFMQASVSVLDSLEAGSHIVEHTIAVVQDLGQVRAADRRIRGVLGEDFLAHFDMLIDYGHKMICLDAAGVMRDNARGERVSLVGLQNADGELPFAQRLVIAVHLSGAGSREVLLQLDSGSDGPILYQANREARLSLLDHAVPRSGAMTAAQRAFATLPPQDLHIGGSTLNQVPFVTPVTIASDTPSRKEDGLLPTILFQRVFISFAGRFITINPR